MTSYNSQYDFTFVVSTLEQLQAEQNIWKDNTIWLKRYFDELKQEVQTRPPREEVDKMQEVISQLTAQVNELQQRIDNIASSTQSLNSVDVLDTQKEETYHSTIEKQFVECSDEHTHQDISIDDSVIAENINPIENEESQEINTLEELEEDSKGLSDIEFKLERIMWLINRVYTSETPIEEIRIDGEEFWRRYNQGERDFTEINLIGADLTAKSPSEVNFRKANLIGVTLRGKNLGNINLSKANLTQADLNCTVLENANLEEATLESANLCQAKLTGAIMPDGTIHE
ncbi:pentapeptide repeat protein [Calothrix sp. NIES-4071]|nr:pentapeptide repeat protein [Calothrix sp. NIES-4071]BAZ57709.1 pentapeptide repeat protein [Calothrix sp. NIES-4105]